MNVWITAYSQRNPYMSLLTEHLNDRGLEVEEDVLPQSTIALRGLWEGFPDILHLHWLGAFHFVGDPGPLEPVWVRARVAATLELLKRAQRRGTGIVWTAHNLSDHEGRFPGPDERFHREVARLADGIAAHSGHAKSSVVEEFGLERPAKVSVIPHGNYVKTYPNEISRAEARRRLNVPTEARVFLFVGLIRPYKNIPSLIETFGELPGSRGARLLVAGSPRDGSLEQVVRERAGEDPNVELVLEYIPDDELQVYLKAADIVVLPYRKILTSGSAVLAMSFGRPVIAPKLGTIRDVVGPHGGFLYDPSDPEGLEAALSRGLDADRSELREIGERNLERARGWSWESVARQTQQLYERARR